MDIPDIVIGIILIGLLAWLSIIALNQNAARVSISDLYARTELNKALISPAEICPEPEGFTLVKPEAVSLQPYHITAGKTDFNQTYFCFYSQYP